MFSEVTCSYQNGALLQNLTVVEWISRARRRLADTGIQCQWPIRRRLELKQSDDDDFLSPFLLHIIF